MEVRERIQLSRVKDGLRTEVFGRPLLSFRELTSTNDMAKELAVGDAREGTVILAEVQTEGRGRLRREWVSPEGGLWLSIILGPRTELRHYPKLTLMASVAAAKTIRRLYRLKAEIRWPNDVLINDKKVCGILTEATTKGETVGFVVVGIGINANFSRSALPVYLRGSATTLKEELGKEIERENLLRMLLEEMESYYGLFKKGKFDVILKEWRSLAGFLGSYVEVLVDDEKIRGWASDIDEDGALMVKLKDKTVQKVTSGDLKMLKTAQ